MPESDAQSVEERLYLEESLSNMLYSCVEGSRRRGSLWCHHLRRTVYVSIVCEVSPPEDCISTVCEVSPPEDCISTVCEVSPPEDCVSTVCGVTTWGLYIYSVWRTATTEICVYHLGPTSQCRHAWRRRHDHHALPLNIRLSLMTVDNGTSLSDSVFPRLSLIGGLTQEILHDASVERRMSECRPAR